MIVEVERTSRIANVSNKALNYYPPIAEIVQIRKLIPAEAISV